jgi:hypothetical protein
VILIGGAYKGRSSVAGVAEAISCGNVAAVTYDSNDGYADNLSLVLQSAGASGSGNLIVDGDAEAATCSLSGYEETTVPGWTITSGGPNAVCFNTGGFPSASAPGAQPGNAYFTGGTRGNSSLSQTVDVSADGSAIDGGTASYDLSGWLGGYGSQNDRAALVATFLNSSGASLGTTQIGPVTNTDRGNVTEFLQRVATGSIPVGTRQIKLDLDFTWTAAQTTDGYADNRQPVADHHPVHPAAGADTAAVDGPGLRPRVPRVYGEQQLLVVEQHRRRRRRDHR